MVFFRDSGFSFLFVSSWIVADVGAVLPEAVLMSGSGLDAVLHAVALALNNDRFGMMQDAVENGRGERGVVVEDGRPLLEDLVGGQHDGALFVALADNLEEQVRPAIVDG